MITAQICFWMGFEKLTNANLNPREYYWLDGSKYVPTTQSFSQWGKRNAVEKCACVQPATVGKATIQSRRCAGKGHALCQLRKCLILNLC